MTRRKLKAQILGILSEDDYNPDDIETLVLKYKFNQSRISFKLICKAAACEIKVDEMLIKNRKPMVVLARHLVFTYYRNKHPEMTYEKIGDLFGLDHATTLSGIRRLKNLLDVGDRMAVTANTKFYELINK